MTKYSNERKQDIYIQNDINEKYLQEKALLLKKENQEYLNSQTKSFKRIKESLYVSLFARSNLGPCWS